MRLFFIPLLLALFINGVSQTPDLYPRPQHISYNHQKFPLGSDASLMPVKKEINRFYKKNLAEEGYEVYINSDKAVLSANTVTGIYYGMQTLKNLAAFDSVQGSYFLPGVEITDYPEYAYRGMHLDVSRHFFSKEVIERYIDELAASRINYFHWHLTDDQGWRLEIKKYPKLTQVGAWRIKFSGDKYGGYYTQSDVREIVTYAAERHITVIPEIEMPGHSSAAIAAYPWLSCNGQGIPVPDSWGIFENIYCPADSVFQFLFDVLDEVCELFPGPYIHIGGDEVPKAAWKKSPAVKELMTRKGLRNYEQVQHYFMKTIEDYLLQKGKRCMEWGEAARGGLSDSTIVMSWRGKLAGKRAARKGNEVIMAPRFFCYFDYPQSRKEKKPSFWMTRITTKKVSRFHPECPLLSESKNHNIIGGEATLWTEHVADEKKLWRQLQPRLSVFGEVMWSGQKK